MTLPQTLSILGATGSIGVNTLDVIAQCGGVIVLRLPLSQGIQI